MLIERYTNFVSCSAIYHVDSNLQCMLFMSHLNKLIITRVMFDTSVLQLVMFNLWPGTQVIKREPMLIFNAIINMCAILAIIILNFIMLVIRMNVAITFLVIDFQILRVCGRFNLHLYKHMLYSSIWQIRSLRHQFISWPSL